MSNQKQNNRPRGPMGRGMRGGGEKAKDFKGTMKKLFNYIKPFKFTFLIGILCAVVSVCIMVIGPKIQGNIITEIAEGFMNKVQGKGGIDFDAIKKTCALLLAIYAMSTAFSYLQGWLMSGVSNKMGYQLRKEMNQKIDKLPLSYFDKNIMNLWGKILVGCIPAAIIGLLFDDVFEALFYNPFCIAIALIVFGIAFIIVENWRKDKKSAKEKSSQITYKDALIIGCFQLLAAIFPGTSRSGATIIGGLLIGLSRPNAAEFTFYLAIPTMLGASLLKLVKFGFGFTSIELVVLLVGMIISFLVSLIVIKFLMSYIKKHNFKVFGYYRIILGIIVLTYFFFTKV